MNTKYSNWKMWYYVLCMVLTLQLAACSEETHDEYTAAPEIEDTDIDQLDALIAEMTDLQQIGSKIQTTEIRKDSTPPKAGQF